MVKYQIAQQVFKRNFDRFSIACDHSSIIIIIIVIIITTTTTSLSFSQKWTYSEIRKMIIMNRQNKHSCIILEPRGWRSRQVFQLALYELLLLLLSLLLFILFVTFELLVESQLVTVLYQQLYQQPHAVSDCLSFLYRWENLTRQHNNQRIAYFPTKKGTI